MTSRCALVLLWLYGSWFAYAVDAALDQCSGVSPIRGNPLFGGELVGLRLVLGVFLAGGVVAASRGAAGLRRLTPLALAFSVPALALSLALVHRRGWDECHGVSGVALLGVLALPAVERRSARPGAVLTWIYAFVLAVYFYESEPAHSIARSGFPSAVCWWIGVAALGAALCHALWRRGLQAAAVSSAAFWTCATWSLLANSLWVSRYSVGLRGVVWRSSGGPHVAAWAPDHGSIGTVLTYSAPSFALLLTLLWFGFRFLMLVREDPDPPTSHAMSETSLAGAEL